MALNYVWKEILEIQGCVFEMMFLQNIKYGKRGKIMCRLRVAADS
jgi:hypothetical protein